MALSAAPALEIAQTFLMLPDLINYWLTGRVACEYTIASTSHLLEACTKQWAYPLMEAMGIPTRIFPEIVEPGQVLEKLHHTVVEETGLGPIPVVATASHDTAAAVATVPAQVDNHPLEETFHAYLSSGTWGLLGTELSRPLLSEKALTYNFANEGGPLGTIRLLNNALNLWLLQECQRIWALEGKDYTWGEMVQMAERVEPLIAFIDPHAPEFLTPEHMPKQLQAACHQTGQRVPETKGGIIRMILESLAFKYRYTIEKLADILGKKPQVLHIVGGGGRNKMLSQFAANAINIPVVTGPYEATSIGNIIMQMIATGDLTSLEEGRELVSVSFPIETYLPVDSDVWEEQYRKYIRVTGLPFTA
jgi:sugar (pentulose or hexulose) kinase